MVVESNEKLDRYQSLRYLATKVTNQIVVLTATPTEWVSLTQDSPRNLPIGMLGTTLPFALGIALALPQRQIICIATDGDVLMELSALPTIGEQAPKNLLILVNDNECYQSTMKGPLGFFPSATAGKTDLAAVAKGCGVANVHTVTRDAEFRRLVDSALTDWQLRFFVLKTRPEMLKEPIQNRDGFECKYRFIRMLEEEEGITILPQQKKNLELVDPSIKSGKPKPGKQRP